MIIMRKKQAKRVATNIMKHPLARQIDVRNLGENHPATVLRAGRINKALAKPLRRVTCVAISAD